MTPFFTLFVLSRASDNTTSQNIGGTDAWAVPHLTFWGDRPPVPLGLRLWKRLTPNQGRHRATEFLQKAASMQVCRD